MRPGSFAILGTRGVPARYGGFETFAAELSRRLVARGHQVTVYCRSSLYDGEPEIWQGVRRVELPAARHKYLETVTHAFLSAVHAAGARYDAVLVCNAANAFVLPILRAARIPAAINVDGIERKRRKWNAAGRAFYGLGEAMSVHWSSALVADAGVIADYYRSTWAAPSTVIPYGSDFPLEEDSDVLARLGVQPGGYVLYVSRFEPENNPLQVVREYGRSSGEVPLVMVGDAPYASALIAQVHAEADGRVIFTGGLYDADYRTLQRNAALYIQATEIGGTHPAMIEAMSSGGAVLANGTPENVEVGGDTVIYFDIHQSGDLSKKLRWALDNPAAVSVYRTKARSRSRSRYSWDHVTDLYESLLSGLRRE